MGYVYRDIEFHGYVHGGDLLGKDLVVKARQLDLELLRKFGVDRKVHKSAAEGHQVLTTKWADADRGGQEHLDYRSRFAGTGRRLDICAAPPPFGSTKAISADCAMGRVESSR